MNTGNLSPSMTKAIEAGGTNNTIIGNALVKRGIFMEAGMAPEPSAGHPFRFVPIIVADAITVDVEPEHVISVVEQVQRETGESERIASAMIGEVTGAPVLDAKRVPAATFALSEQEIEENAAIKLADTIRRDEEMQAEKTVAFIAECERQKAEEVERLTAEAKQAIEDADRTVRELTLPIVDLHAAMANLETARLMLTSDTPWEARHIANRTAEMWPRVVRLRADFENAPDWRKERITVALATMGTVVYPEGTLEHTAYGQDLTAALSEWKTTGEKRYRVEFERIGRVDNPKPLFIATFETVEAFETKIRRYAGKFLASREFSVDVEIVGETGTVLIEGGRFGKGIIVLDS